MSSTSSEDRPPNSNSSKIAELEVYSRKNPSTKESRMEDEELLGLLHMQPDSGCEFHAPMKGFRLSIAAHGISVSIMAQIAENNVSWKGIQSIGD
jgi:hypothetical protein